jgi:hypothetical protein
MRGLGRDKNFDYAMNAVVNRLKLLAPAAAQSPLALVCATRHLVKPPHFTPAGGLHTTDFA